MSDSKIIMPPKPIEEEPVPANHCPNCRWFEPHAGAMAKPAGGCRINPPQVCFVGQQQDKLGRVQPLTMSFWPAVGGNDWCAKFEARTPVKLNS